MTGISDVKRWKMRKERGPNADVGLNNRQHLSWSATASHIQLPGSKLNQLMDYSSPDHLTMPSPLGMLLLLLICYCLFEIDPNTYFPKVQHFQVGPHISRLFFKRNRIESNIFQHVSLHLPAVHSLRSDLPARARSRWKSFMSKT
jgi:hypothetical protein